LLPESGSFNRNHSHWPTGSYFDHSRWSLFGLQHI